MYLYLILLILILCKCNVMLNEKYDKLKNNTSTSVEYTNQLIGETSPYLLQHAHNPVNWYPWGNEALQKAKQENKLLLISIGYSACHWCHVMEHECFEDTVVAKIMNESFINIKVDREERPDIDQVYMTAVQLMTQSGGWPLNCIALPDGRPVYGGTYFPRKQWINVLVQISESYEKEPKKFEEYAERLTQGIQQSELIEKINSDTTFHWNTVVDFVNKWQAGFDFKEGGPNRAPKFPIPNNFDFLLQYGYLAQDKKILDYVELTLKKMAYGGIYDQVGGGFARYSTDAYWKVPHFEKMLYDNAQLVSLYSQAYKWNHNPLYKQVVFETLEWVEREMTSKEGFFYSALDADSEGEEGKFYVWEKEELKELLGADFELAQDYFNVNDKGYWENKQYILLRDDDNEQIAKKHKLSLEELLVKIEKIKKILLDVRDKRIHPGLDDKSLTSWNAMMIKAYLDAYGAFNEKKFLDAASNSMNVLLKSQKRKDGGLNHNYKNGVSNINAYLEDYCFVIDALIHLYQSTFDEKWLDETKSFAKYTIEHFFDERSGMFYFTSDLDDKLIARKMEINDNVIPASNSVMAKNLFLLGHLLDNKDYLEKSDQMLQNILSNMNSYPSGYSNWAQLLLCHVKPFYEIAISGKEANQKKDELNQNYLPNTILLGAIGESELPLLENKFVKDKTLIYVCVNKSCQLPVEKVEDARKQIQY